MARRMVPRCWRTLAAVDAVDGSGVSVSTFRFARSIFIRSTSTAARSRVQLVYCVAYSCAAARARDDERVALAGRSCGRE